MRKKNFTTDTWASVADAIELKQTHSFSVRNGIGNTKDTFQATVNNAKGRLEYSAFNGTGSSKVIQLPFYPIPTDYLGTDNFRLSVDNTDYGYVESSPGTNQFTITGSTVTAGNNFPVGTENVKAYFKVMDTEDLMRIYRWSDAITESNADILTEGPLNGTISQLDSKGRTQTVKGIGLIEVLFKVLAFYKQAANVTKKASEIVESIIDYVNELNSQGNTDNAHKIIRWSTDNVATTKDIIYNSQYKKAIEILEDLSTDEYTGGGQYISYITYNATDDAYDFHFVARPTTSTNTLSEGTDFTSVKVNKNSDALVNSAIYNCGVDCEGNGQEYLYIDFTAKGNSSWKYINSTNGLFTDLLNKEFENDITKWAYQTDTNSINIRTSSYPTTTALNAVYTFTFNTRANIFPYNETTTASSASTLTGFNQAVRDECRAIGWRHSKGVVDQLNDFRIEVSGEIPVHKISSAFSAGNLHTMNLASLGVVNKDLRIENLKHNLVTTDPDLKEDEDKTQ